MDWIGSPAAAARKTELHPRNGPDWLQGYSGCLDRPTERPTEWDGTLAFAGRPSARHGTSAQRMGAKPARGGTPGLDGKPAPARNDGPARDVANHLCDVERPLLERPMRVYRAN